MKIIDLRFRFNLLICLLIVSCGITSVHAQEIQIEVKTKNTPTAALGVFFDSQKVIQQPNTKIERLNDNFVIVSIPYDSTKAGLSSGFASAYVITDKDELIFGTTKMLPPFGKAESIWKLPSCPVNSINPKSGIPIEEQLNYLESLFQIRLKKRELLFAEIKSMLDVKTLSSLSTIESRFGLEEATPLEAETNPYLLNSRIRKIKDAILLYKGNKAK